MPLYEYQCGRCGQRIEKIQSLRDAPLTECACGGPLERLISAPALQFKGTGWYVTDYANKSSAPAGKNGGDSAKADTGKTDAGATQDAKPAPTTPAKKDKD